MPLFHSARFMLSVAQADGLPPPALPEIAFAGRSNAGKSTAINLLTGQKRLAFASKTPGRTQLLNFFEVSERDGDTRIARAYLVDLPGYGYAEAPRAQRAQWDALVGGYVAERENLIGIAAVMDARRPFTAADEQLIEFVQRPGRKIHFVLTKADQLRPSEQRAALAVARERAAALGGHTAQLLSALNRAGVDELGQTLEGWLGR